MKRLLLILGLLASAASLAQAPSGVVTTTSPASKEWPVQDGVFDIPHFQFRDGGTLPLLHLHYLTLGTLHRDGRGHADNAVLLLHGTGGNARSLLNPLFADELFGPGQPLDITKYFLIFPDDIGHGQWINSADDFINPPELGIAERMVAQMPNARFVLLPISDATSGHGTHTLGAVWKNYLIDFLHKTQT